MPNTAPVIGGGLQFSQPTPKKPAGGFGMGAGGVTPPTFGTTPGPFSAGSPVAPAPNQAGTPGSMTPLPGGGNLPADNNFSPGVQPGPVQSAAPQAGGSGGVGGTQQGVQALPGNPYAGLGGAGGGNPFSQGGYDQAIQNFNAQQASQFAQQQQFAKDNSPMALLREKAKLEQAQWQREVNNADRELMNAEARAAKPAAGMGATQQMAPQQSTSATMVFDPVLGYSVPTYRNERTMQPGADGTISMQGGGVIRNPALDALRDAKVTTATEAARGATMANDANQVKLDAMRQGALWNRANSGDTVNFSHTGDGVNHSIGSGGGGAAGARKAGAGGGTSGDYTLDEILGKFQNLLPTEPLPRETGPTAPAQVAEAAPISLASRTAMNAANFGQAKDRVGRLSMSALRDVRNNMTARGISGSGIEGRMATDTINAGYGQLGDVIREQANADSAIEQDVANKNAEMSVAQRGQNLAQRGQDIGVAGQDYSGRITQRGQDAANKQNRFNSILALINQYGGRLY